MFKLLNMFRKVDEIYSVYWKNSEFQLIFIISLLVIWIMEKNRKNRCVLLWYPIICLIALSNPLTIIIGDFVWGDDVAYFCRQFSLIPIFGIIAYAAISVFRKLSDFKKFISVALLVVVIILYGKCIYEQPWYTKANNIMKIPEGIAEVCEKLSSEKEHVTLMVPSEWASYVRQYDASIHLTTFRDDNSKLANEVSSNNPDVSYIMQVCCANGTDYVVVNDTNDIRKRFSELNYTPFYKVAKYLVYKCEGYPMVKKEYNEKEQIIAKIYLDSNGDRMAETTGYGYSKISYTYDEYGNCNGEYYYDVDDVPMKIFDGSYGKIWVNNKKGVSLELTYVDANGNPLINEDGYATEKYERNSKNQIIKKTFYDDKLNITKLPSNASIIEYELDEYGNPVKEIYMNENEKPILTDDGYACITREYNKSNLITEEAYCGTDEKPIVQKKGYCKVIYSYDDMNNKISEFYYGTDGKLKCSESGYAGITYVYNEYNLVTEQFFYDVDGERIVFEAKYSGIKTEYDEEHRIVKQTYLNSEGEPTLISDGYCSRTYIRDDDGNILETIFLDENDKPIQNNKGYYKAVYSFSKDGKGIQVNYYDIEGNKVTI